VLVSERLLFRSGTQAALDELRTEVLLHEMAHMWFGGPGDRAVVGNDLWLSESFAEFCGGGTPGNGSGCTRGPGRCCGTSSAAMAAASGKDLTA